MSRAVVQHDLTEAQAQLLERHRRGLQRLAAELARRNGTQSTEILFTLADRRGRIGLALGAVLPVASIGPVILPGRAAELEAWVERLALHGPVWDFVGRSTGIAVIVIDHDDHMALCRVASTAELACPGTPVRA